MPSNPKPAGIAHNIVMNEDQIYCKTPEGERALLQRTRLVQRNLRNVLILVDGATSVADLTRKLGDGGFLRASLGELVRGGFIETLEEHRVRRGLEAVNAPEGEPKTIPVPDPEPARAIELPPQVDSVLPEHSGWRIEPRMSAQDAEVEVPSAEPDPVRASALPAEASRSEPFWKRWLRRSNRSGMTGASLEVPEPAPTEPPPERRPKVRIKPIRRGTAAAPRASWSARILIALLATFVLAVVVAILFPYDRYRGTVEQRASAWLGQPVSIASMRLALTPVPGLMLERVTIGDRPGVMLGAVRLIPNPLSLFDPTWKLGTVVLERPSIDQGAILALLAERQTAAAHTLSVPRLRIEDATLSLAGMTLAGISGDVLLTPQAELAEIRVADDKGTLQLVAAPEGRQSLKLKLSGTGWRAPIGNGVAVDSIDAQGILTRDALRADKLEMRTLEGAISATGSIDWSRDVDVTIQARYARIALQRLLALTAPTARVQGEVSGRLNLRGSATTLNAALRALSGSGSFKIERGTFQGFDLVEAVRNARSETPVRGGEARLEDLEGALSFDADGWRLNGLRGGSGALNAFGHLNQSAGRLAGAMEVQLRGSASQMNVPVAISGTLADPVLKGRRGAGPSISSAGEAGNAAELLRTP